MEIRKLTEADYDQVIDLYVLLDEIHAQGRPDCFTHREKDQVYPRDAYIHNLSYPDGVELGAFDGVKLIGFVRATLWNKSFSLEGVKTVCLDDIYVIPEYRRRGVAAKLFAETESWAKARGAVRLELHVWDFNKSALAMYEAMGMKAQRHVLEKKL